jgi:hypothetical protein
MGEFNWNATEQITAHLSHTLSRCPGLVDLHLHPWHPAFLHAQPIFEHGRWPLLNRLSIRRIFPPYNSATLQTFIDAHPNLEHLYIDTDNFDPPNTQWVWAGSFPNLKALHIGPNWAIRPIMTPNTKRNLEYLSVVDMRSADRVEHLRILGELPILRFLAVQFSTVSPVLLDRLAQAVPQ